MTVVVCHLSRFCPLRCTATFIALVFGPVILNYLTPAQADTPAQARYAIQVVCNRAAMSFEKRDLSGFMAMYSRNLTIRSVPGIITDFRQTQSGVTNAFANNHYSATVRCTVSQVVPQGKGAKVVLRWHYVSHYTNGVAVQKYTIVRDYEERSFWQKFPPGWREMSSDIIHDVLSYER